MAIRKGGYIDFRANGPVGVNPLVTGPAFPTSAAAQVDAYTCGPYTLFMGQLTACSTTLYPGIAYNASPDASGWTMPHAATASLGTEIALSILADPNSPYVFKVGTDPAFFMSAEFSSSAVANPLTAGCGFRTAGAMSATVANWALAKFADASANPYADVQGLSLQQTTASTIYNINKAASTGNAQVSTTQTMVNSTKVKFTIKVSAAGVCTAYVNDVLATAGSTLGTIAAATLLTPWFAEQNGAGATSVITLQSLAWGYQ